MKKKFHCLRFASLGLAALAMLTGNTSLSAQEAEDVQDTSIKAEVVEGSVIITTSDGKSFTVDLNDIGEGPGLMIQAEVDDDGKATMKRTRGVLVAPNGSQQFIFDGDGANMAQLQLLSDIPGWAWSNDSGSSQGIEIQRMITGDAQGFRVGINCSPIGDAMKAQTGLKFGLVVENVEEDSPAEKGGLQKFDIILRAGDDDVEEVERLVEVIQESGKSESDIDLKLHRRGAKLQLSITPELSSDGFSETRMIQLVDPRVELESGIIPGEFKFHRVLPGLIQNDVELIRGGIENPELKQLSEEVTELRKLVEQLRDELRNK